MNKARQRHREAFSNQAPRLPVIEFRGREVVLRPSQQLGMHYTTQHTIELVTVEHRALQNCRQALSVCGQPRNALGHVDPRATHQVSIADPLVFFHFPVLLYV